MILILALLFKGVTDKLICTPVFRNDCFFPFVKFFSILYSFLCDLWKCNNMLGSRILTDAHIRIPPSQWLQNFKICVFIT